MHLIALLGQTCSGKSDMAVDLAESIMAKSNKIVWIINCDSRQVYKDLNIGTGKVNGEWRSSKIEEQFNNVPSFPKEVTQSAAGLLNQVNNFNKAFFYRKIPHFLIDFVDPRTRYGLNEYIRDWIELFGESIAVENQKPRMPDYVILTGGTGLYAKAILEKYQLGEVKTEFTQIYENYKKDLQEMKLDELAHKYKSKLESTHTLPKLNRSDVANPRRLQNWLLRAQSQANSWHQKLDYPEFESQQTFAIQVDQDELKLKIKNRLESRIQSGLLQEVTDLQGKYNLNDRFLELGLEYRLTWLYLNGQLSSDEWENQMYQENLQYAKRQLTWLKKENPNWVTSIDGIYTAGLHTTQRL